MYDFDGKKKKLEMYIFTCQNILHPFLRKKNTAILVADRVFFLLTPSLIPIYKQ